MRCLKVFLRADMRIRTADLRITSASHYLLCYIGLNKYILYLILKIMQVENCIFFKNIIL